MFHRKYFLLTSVCLCALFSGVRISIVGPLYPLEANHKGLSIPEYSLTLSVYNSLYIIFVILSELFIKKIGPHFVFVSSSGVTGLACAWFGLLHYVDNKSTFLVLSAVNKAVEAIATALNDVTLTVLINIHYKQNPSMFLALKEAFISLGTCIGPPLAGFVYDVTNFCTPFLGTGCFIILSTFISVVPLISSEISSACGEKTKNNCLSCLSTQKTHLKVLLLPGMWIGILSNILIAVSYSFISSVLEPYIRVFHLSAFTLSLFFAIPNVMFSLLSPMVGKMMHNGIKPVVFIFLGTVCQVVSFIFMGPLPRNNP